MAGVPADDAAPKPADARTAAPGDADVGALQKQLADLEGQLAETKDRALRARADYDNLQKRTSRESELERARAKARTLEQFLPILELAHMAAQQAEHHPGPLSEGVLLLAREFDRFAAREGLQRTGMVGEAVDAARHEVLAEEPAEGPGVAPGRISRVVAPGYVLDGRVLRVAKVCAQPGISKPPAPPA